MKRKKADLRTCVNGKLVIDYAAERLISCGGPER